MFHADGDGRLTQTKLTNADTDESLSTLLNCEHLSTLPLASSSQTGLSLATIDSTQVAVISPFSNSDPSNVSVFKELHFPIIELVA